MFAKPLNVVDTIHSKIDKTIKYVIRLDDGLIAEVAYIDKDEERDIICIGCQTACSCGCKFCHTSDALGKVKNRNLAVAEMEDMAMFVINKHHHKGRFSLVSYMGCGEPMMNMLAVSNSMWGINVFKGAKFALATLMPKSRWDEFFEFTRRVEMSNPKMHVKVHLSLHFTQDNLRHEWMPAAWDIAPSLAALNFYHKATGCPVEVHYALIDGVNDSDATAWELVDLLKPYGMHVKILKYNARGDSKPSSEDRLDDFISVLQHTDTSHEYYEPPGIDVGASCGQFLLDYYYRYNADDK